MTNDAPLTLGLDGDWRGAVFVMVDGETILQHGKLTRVDEDRLIELFRKFIQKEKPHVVILEDYNKGVLTQRLIPAVISIARQAGVLIAVDPKRKNFFEYRGVDIFKPNLKDVKEALNLLFGDADAAWRAAESFADPAVDFPRYVILGACNPSLAHRALQAERVGVQVADVEDERLGAAGPGVGRRVRQAGWGSVGSGRSHRARRSGSNVARHRDERLGWLLQGLGRGRDSR